MNEKNKPHVPPDGTYEHGSSEEGQGIPSDGGSLERLEKRLYKRGEDFHERARRPELSPTKNTVAEDWSAKKESDDPTHSMPTRKKRSLLTLFLLGSGFVALITVAVAAWLVLFGGAGTISPAGIDLTIEAPSEITGGDLVTWEVILKNNSGRDLETADLIFEYPENARPVREGERETKRQRISLGVVRAGEEVRKTFEGFLFGAEEGVEVARATLEYRAAGANVILARDREHTTRISRAPLVVSVRAPEEVNIGDEIAMDIEIISQAKEVLENVVLEVAYPSEFSFLDASVIPSFGDAQWFLGSLAPEEAIRITVRGTLTGQELQKVVFVAQAGLREDERVGVVYGGDVATITLARPFLDFGYRVNDALVTTVEAEDFVSVDIVWKNNLSVSIENAVLRVRIEGEGFEEASIQAPDGFYRGSDRTVIWNASSYAPFAFIEPGREGKVNFRFRIVDALPIRSPSDANFSIRLSGTFEALKRPPGFESIDVATSKTYEIKIATDLQVVRKALYYFSALPGSGPLPPRVGQETVYTIVWSLANTGNDVRNVHVRASLPPYMVWKGVVSPLEETMAYDDLSGEITWSIDMLPAGTGIIRPAKEVRFQAGFIPFAGDVGTFPILVGSVSAQGQDAFTGSTVRDSAPAQNIELRSDPQSTRDEWNVLP